MYSHSYKDRIQLLPSILHQILSTLVYIHKHDVCHRDMKPDNILLQIHKDGGCHVRICDFGLSKRMMLKRNTPKTSTLWYRAPENLQAIPEYDSKIDIWPIGCIIYEHIHQKVLFRGNNSKDTMIRILCCLGPVKERIYKRLRINKNKMPKRWKKIRMLPFEDNLLSDLMHKCLTLHPNERPSALELLQNGYYLILIQFHLHTLQNPIQLGFVFRIRINL